MKISKNLAGHSQFEELWAVVINWLTDIDWLIDWRIGKCWIWNIILSSACNIKHKSEEDDQLLRYVYKLKRSMLVQTKVVW